MHASFMERGMQAAASRYGTSEVGTTAAVLGGGVEPYGRLNFRIRAGFADFFVAIEMACTLWIMYAAPRSHKH